MTRTSEPATHRTSASDTGWALVSHTRWHETRETQVEVSVSAASEGRVKLAVGAPLGPMAILVGGRGEIELSPEHARELARNLLLLADR